MDRAAPVTGLVLSCLVVAACVGPVVAQGKGIPASGVIDLAGEADASLVGGTVRDRAGFAVEVVGDVNGDGHPDVAVGAPDASPSGRAKAGIVHIVFGPYGPDRDLATASGLRIVGAAAGDGLGTAVTPAGDLDGDGLADVLVGAPHGDGGAGAAYVVSGRRDPGVADLAEPGAAFLHVTGAQPGDGLGTAVAGLGDVDADGVPDLAVGSPGADRAGTDGGAVDVVFGSRAGGTADVSALGDRGYAVTAPAGAGAGVAVAPAGDVDGDGRADLLLGAPAWRGGAIAQGAAFVLRGRLGGQSVALDALPAGAGWEFDGHPGDLFGVSVSSAGDVNGDGRPDLVVGAPWARPGDKPGAGSAYVLLLPPDPAVVDVSSGVTAAQGLRIDGVNPNESTGAEVRGLGDIDGDGSPDVVVTAPFADALGRHEPGVAYVIRAGKVAAPRGQEPVVVKTAGLGEAGFRVVGPGDGSWLYGASRGGDLDGDGAPDLLLGAVAARRDSTASGGAYVVLSPKPVPPAASLPPDPGVQEEQQAGCHATQLVEMIIDDSGSMSDTDGERLRARAMQLLLSKPRNIGKALGAVEFGDVSGEIFPPQAIRDPAEDPAQARELLAIVDRTVRADNGGTDYNLGFAAAASAAPKADARIFLTDGEHNVGKYRNGHRNGPPTYVIGLSIGRRGSSAERLRRIADETKGKYFPNVTSEKLQPVFNAIDSKLNCDVGLDAFVDSLSDQDTTEPNDVVLNDDTHSADLNVSWDDPQDLVTPGDVEVLDDRGAVVQRISARMQRLALLKRGKARLTSGSIELRGRRGRTFYTMRINGTRGATLRVRTSTREVRGTARVHTQVTQSRRRR